MACISKRRGKWVVDYRDTSGKRIRETIDGNRDDAKQKLSEVLKDEGQVTETKQTFKDYGVEWLNTYARTHLKESTFREYEAVFNNHLVPAFGSMLFTKIKRAAVKKLIADKIRAKKSRSTVRNIIAPLREMFNHAIDDGVASFNPATRVGRFNKRKDRGTKIDPLTKDEVATFLKTAREKVEAYYPLFLCAARSGLREGELIGLRPYDLDFNGRFINVERNISRGKVTTPKNGKTRRVDMSLQLTNTLDALVAARKAEAVRKELEKAADERREPDEVMAEVMEDWLFVDPSSGKQLDPNNMRKRVFYRCLDRAELRRVRFHDLRHTYASLLIQQGESLAYVKDQLGHHSIQITVDTYGHLVPGGNRQAVDQLDDVEEVKTEDHLQSGHKMVTSQLDRGADDA